MPATSQERLDSIDALRGFAALYVVLYHLALLPNPNLSVPAWGGKYILTGGTGVTLFFVISAFCLCLSMRRHRQEPSPALRFYTRRLFRIAPLFYFCLAAYWVRDWLWFKVAHSLPEVLLNMSFAFNFVPGRNEGYVRASWTIGVEMVFYMIFRFIFRYVNNLWKSVVFFFLTLLVAYGYMELVKLLPIADSLRESFVRTSFLRQMPIFALGIIAFFAFEEFIQNKVINRLWAFLLVGSALYGYNALLSGKLNFFLNEYYWQGVIYGVLLLGLAVAPLGLLVNRRSCFYGEISYSVYLLHPTLVAALTPLYRHIYSMPMPVTLQYGACLLLTLSILTPLAYLSFRFIEKPGMRLGSRLAKKIVSEKHIQEDSVSQNADMVGQDTRQGPGPTAVDYDCVISKLATIKPYIWLMGILLLAFAARCYHINGSLDDTHAFRQTQTAGLIRDYFRAGINLLYPSMITLGNPGYVVLEFPAYQALAALLYKLFSPNVIYARLLTISFGLASIIFVYRLSRRFFDERSSVLAAFFYAFMPLNIFFQRVPMPDSLTIMLSLVMADFLIEGIKGRNLFLLAGILAASIGIVIKMPIVAPLYLPLLYIAWQERENRGKALARFFAAAVIPFLVLSIWQQHANSVNEAYFSADAYPFNILYGSVVVKLKSLNYWYFGNLAQRLDINNYFVIWRYIYNQLFAVVGVLFFFAGLLSLATRKKEGGLFLFLWFLAISITVMIFFNLYVVHNYYHLFWAPLLAIVCGAGASALSSLFSGQRLLTGLAFALVVYFSVLGLTTAKNNLFRKENTWVDVGKFIDSNTEKKAMIATSPPLKGDCWGPMLMYYSDRRGFNIPHEEITSEMIGYLKKQNIRYLAVADASEEDFPALATAYVVAEDRRVTVYDLTQNEEQRPHRPSRKRTEIFAEARPKDLSTLFLSAGGKCNMESINGATWGNQPFTTEKKAEVSIIGWGVDDKKKQLPEKIYLHLRLGSREFYAAANERIDRPDVAQYLDEDAYINSGYKAALSLDGLPAGQYQAMIVMTFPDRALLCASGRTLLVK